MMKKLLLQFCAPLNKKNNSTINLRTCFVTLFMTFGFMITQAQVSSYVATGSGVAQTYTPVPAGTGIFGTGAWLDVVSGAINLGFNFNFNGRVYTQCFVSANGFITFGSAPTNTNFTPISSLETYEGAIAVYGRDLRSNGIDVLYQIQGAAPNRTFTVQYTCIRATGITSAGPLNMQIILHESNPLNVTDPGVVELKYNTVTPIGTASAALTGQVGLRGEIATDWKNKNWAITGNWPTANPVFPDGTLRTQTVTTRTQTPTSIANITRLVFTPPTCFAPRRVTATPTSITHNSAVITWIAPVNTLPNPPAASYDYFYTTTVPTNTASLPNVLTVPTVSGIVGTTATIPAPTLTPSTVYYVYVRSNCGPLGGWSAAGTFTTLCAPYADPFITTIPYTQNFNAAVAPTIPACNKTENVSFPLIPFAGPLYSSYWVTSVPSVPSWGFATSHMRNTVSGGQNNDATYFTQGISLTAGVSYRLSYKYGASNEFAFTENSMEVLYGTSPYFAGMSVSLDDHPSVKGGPFTNVINFTPAVSQVYFFGFYDYTAAANATLLLDDVDIRVTTCVPPTALTSGSVTPFGATIAWTGTVVPPGTGYEYFYNTTNIAPNNSTIPLGSTTALTTSAILGALTPNTTYYFWVRSNCGSGDVSSWAGSGTFMTLINTVIPYCLPLGISFQDPNGIINVTMGTINNTTGIEINNYGNYSNLITNAAQGVTLPVSITYATGFSYDTTIFVDWNNDGDFIDGGESVYTGVAGAGIPTTLLANIPVPLTATLGVHRVRIGGMDFGPVTNPCNSSTYMAFEDYSIFVTIAPTPITLTVANLPICAGFSTPTVFITSGAAAYNTFSWSPAVGVTGNEIAGYVFNPVSTQTFTLTVLNTTTFVTTSVTRTITVNQPPTALSILPVAATVCQGQTPQLLTSSGGIISGFPIFTENFNLTAPGWTTTNATTGASPATADWVLAPNGYSPFFAPWISNDSSQFAFTESDAPGLGSTTATTLTSPVIDLATYTTASLSFWQAYQFFNGPAEGGTVQIGVEVTPGVIPPPASFVTLQTYGTAGNVGVANAFINSIIDITPYALANNRVYIRFKYDATWDWGWAIDNVLVSGSAASPVIWSPTTGLYTSYTDATTNTPYTGTGAATVLALPTSNQVYTATSTSGLGCATSATTSITVTPRSGGTITTLPQTICGGLPALPIVSAGSIGTIVGWEYATNNTFSAGLTAIPGSAGLSTLTTALIGSVPVTRFYRMVVSVGGCANAYSALPAYSITVPSTTWTGVWSNGVPNASTNAIINSNITIAANAFACSLTVNPGANVIVAAGITLSVQNAVTVNPGGSLTFNDDSSLLQGATNVVNNNSGNITYNRNTFMRKFDYTYWSSPVDAQLLNVLSPSTQPDKYYYWDTISYQWTNAVMILPMDIGKGYIIRGPNTSSPTVLDPFTGIFTGKPNNGTYTTPIAISGFGDLNCIGNPYPSAISALAFMTDVSNSGAGNVFGAGTTMYFWTHNTPITSLVYNNADYATYNFSGGTAVAGSSPCAGCNNAAPTGNIAAGQAFMISGIANGNATFKNSMRISGSNALFYRGTNNSPRDNSNQAEINPMENIERNRIWLDLKNSQDANKQILVGYIEGATNEYDQGFDGKLIEAGNAISFYSLLSDKKLTIQGKALPFEINDQVPLGYKTTIAGTFNISIPNKDGLFLETNVTVYLEDKLLNVIHNLNESPYEFVTELGTFDTRFVLRYTNSALGTTIPQFDENAVIAYKEGTSIAIQTTNFNIKSVKVFDVRGRELVEKKEIYSNQTTINNLNAAQQVLLIQITSTDNVIVNKKIVF